MQLTCLCALEDGVLTGTGLARKALGKGWAALRTSRDSTTLTI